MGFFLETLIGGLMAGMLYSLVALGFVLIYKASGVFNFAQGAMVLFAALAMARFAEWIPVYAGIKSPVAANLIAFVLAAGVMFIVAWVIEYLVLRHLVNQEGTTLLMATLGITYFLDGVGQSIFGSCHCGFLSGGTQLVFPEDNHRPCPSRRGRRSPSGSIDWHSFEPHLGHCVVCGRHCGFGGGHDLGLQIGRAILTVFHCPASLAGGDFGRFDFRSWRHHWRPHHWSGREVVRSFLGPLCGWRH